MAEVLTTIFTRDIQSNLFPDSAFFKNSRLDAGAAITAKTVEVPQSGAEPGIEVDPVSFPLTITQRTDNKKSYDLRLFATQPIHVEDVNQAVTSYEKRYDILADHVNKLNETIGTYIADWWAPTGADNLLQTTGSNSRTASAPAATGNRKKVTKADMIDMFNLFNKWNIPMEGRFALFPPDMYADLLEITEFTSADYIMGRACGMPVVTGAVGQIFGFQVFVRTGLPVYSEAAALADITKNAIGAAGATTDNLAALFWHRDFVRRAEGQVKVYADYDKPEYLGSVFNAAVRAGGMYSRNDKKGVAALVQDNA